MSHSLSFNLCFWCCTARLLGFVALRFLHKLVYSGTFKTACETFCFAKSSTIMDVCNACKSNDDAEEPSLAEKFSKLLDQLEHCNEEEQKQKILELKGILEEMNKKELQSISSIMMFYKMDKMIEEKKMQLENAILLLNYVGCCKMLKNVWNPCFEKSSLCERFEKMIFEEEKKKERKNEKLFVDLCECFVFLNGCIDSKMLCVCVPCLLKAASVKEENEEAQKEVEIALLALSRINRYYEVKQELYLNEITEIIKHQQNHRNLTKLAYQRAWQFLINRLHKDMSLDKVIINELHFGREAARELEELARCIDWKKKGEERGKEAKEELTLVRWLETFSIYFHCCRLKNEENVELINSVVQVFRAAKGNNGVICNLCIYSLRNAAEKRVVKVEDLLNGGAVEAVLEEILQPTFNDYVVFDGLKFLKNISYRLKRKEKNENDEMKRKATKKKVFEKLEEEGYEDCTILLYRYLGNGIVYFNRFVKNIEDYLKAGDGRDNFFSSRQQGLIDIKNTQAFFSCKIIIVATEK
ncbi:uncharacterized protein MONOS_15908 [Monocercomonoides exilis]|uniref:uncharacterized protein n=1 Tax=Monocercomonoides exilis TaxID=2049356 RepID=UPI00355948E7|nr:hypothetical protein MONOS_15908 [Monocercomonoides exilis]|eukprot:MONOS_15908.1-p1 / transcript=MONOS_15908.1 / gene=MONOS_15908 / organism=Monocercomonoides_exilis_PA203 / gene_product=unspecified product / transcript_product=unspecified product / location=Mono_scaffold01400:4096-6186(-) / protein_length=527 / sequence_SO=supercontig / SO=protein_coding / is_pseudo=false